MRIKSRFMCFVTLLILSINLLKADEVKLGGVVQNLWDNPVIGAEVKLSGFSNIRATTDSNGLFNLTGEITSVGRSNSIKLDPSVSLCGFNLRVISGKSSPVTVAVYNIAGKKIYGFNAGMLKAGYNVIAIPMTRFGAGVYIIDAAFDENRSVFRYISSGHGSRIYSNSRNPEPVLQKLASSAQAAADTLLVSAEGYQPAKYPVSSYILSGIDITLERASRLVNITRECGDDLPAPVSGGKNGWGSRYWDCCKPHCSWPDKTKHYAANCDINGKESQCFKEIGNEHWTGLEGTKTGCEQDGVAFACYSHVPFAVCKDLAYGFAAVPAGDDACGKCFQIQFDGGFRHGEPKRAHGMVKGKTMIVMASNIGHDVGGGQFDLMIPGGGLGAFRQGCARQWNVDVNDESLVGTGNGGFSYYCQQRVGWDADPEDIKICVKGMCDRLFGDKPALKDLWEGCIWYVEWMHAVDNPTFTYKEIKCPEALVNLYYTRFHPKP